MITSRHQIAFRQFKYFLAVAETLHFRKAADSLYISQPGLSRQIKQLEDLLEMKLFIRHNRKVKLTAVGVYLQKELSLHFKQLDVILNHAKLLQQGVNGNLRLGYVGSAMQKVIPDLLLEFKKIQPNILINLKEMDNKQQIKSILNHDLDIGFVRQERIPNGINAKNIYKETFSLVLPKDHPISSNNFKNLSQFKNEQFIMFDASYSISYYEKVMHIFDDAGFVPQVSHSTINASSIFRLVENNLGISIIPTSLQYGYDMRIKFIELKKIKQKTTLKIIWNKSNSNPVLANLLNIL